MILAKLWEGKTSDTQPPKSAGSTWKGPDWECQCLKKLGRAKLVHGHIADRTQDCTEAKGNPNKAQRPTTSADQKDAIFKESYNKDKLPENKNHRTS